MEGLRSYAVEAEAGENMDTPRPHPNLRWRGAREEAFRIRVTGGAFGDGGN